MAQVSVLVCSRTDQQLPNAVQQGQYLRSASILRLEGASPEESDTGTVKVLATLASSTSLLR